MRRVVVMGSTSAGKTTLSREIARVLGVPAIELDALHWDANWTMAETPVFQERLRAALAAAPDGWVIDGNYGKVRDVYWDQADTVVWLDYTLPLILWRLARRTTGRVARREELWNGNRERLRDHLLSRDSLIWWAITTYRRRRRQLGELFASPAAAHLTVQRFRRPGETANWLRGIANGQESPARAKLMVG